jgi:hypothetical protein
MRDDEVARYSRTDNLAERSSPPRYYVDHHARHGYAMGLVSLKSSAEMIGWGGCNTSTTARKSRWLCVRPGVGPRVCHGLAAVAAIRLRAPRPRAHRRGGDAREHRVAPCGWKNSACDKRTSCTTAMTLCISCSAEGFSTGAVLDAGTVSSAMAWLVDFLTLQDQSPMFCGFRPKPVPKNESARHRRAAQARVVRRGGGRFRGVPCIVWRRVRSQELRRIRPAPCSLESRWSGQPALIGAAARA